MRYKAIIFDMDGTPTLTMRTIGFALLREDIGVADGDILFEVEKQPEKTSQNLEVVEPY